MPPMHIPWLLLFMAMLSSSGGGSGSRSKCGGIYTAAHGILQTPRFPNEFPTPINCEWIIDAQNIATANTSIVVYLTQLYLYEGLTFTEYQIYDTTYQLDGRTVHTVNETNVVQIRWVQSFQNFLVVSLKLDSVDSAHLRVLDKFLDVYGFNITYEITTKPVRSDACTMMDCGFTGICYDHYTKFSCNCFPGYEGPHCSSGPSSFCSRGGSATCKNGGTCIHVGVSAVKCLCPKEFTGDTCQIPISSQTTNACEKCVTSCPFDGRLENACKCKTAVLNATSSERVGYTCTMHLSNLPNLNGEALKTFIKNQVWRTLKSNYSKLEDVAVESIDHFRSGADVTFYFFAMKKDEKRVRSILSKWADRGYIANLTVADKEFIFRPVLDLQSVSINQAGGVIRQQDEFILSCVARGSPTMSFRWFKDGVFVNVSDTSSSKWNRLIKDPDSEDQYTALLGVERSDSLDSGVFACQIEDYGMQQCLSTRVLVRAPPVVKVDPMSRTVRKGDNLTIKCISMGESTLKYTYSWTKNKGLIPVRTENEKYEILYPGGSILQVQKVEKSVKYSCLVQDEVASSETEVDVHVVNPDVVRTCPPENYLGIEWPETAPDTDGMSECPKGYAFPGYVRRSCVFNNGLTPVWRQPDYSHCVSEKLHKIELNFRLLQLGYETAAPIQILEDSLYYLASRSNNNEDSSGGGMGLGLLLYPGEGTRILLLVRDVVSYIKRQRYTGNGNSNSNSNSEFATTRNVTTVVFDVVDGILRQENSLIDQEQIRLLQEVVSQQVTLSSSLLNKLEPSIHLSYKTIDVNMALLGETKNGDISFPAANNDTKWIAHKARVIQKGHPKEKNSIKRQPQPIVVASVIYRNLTTFLPVRSSIRLKDGAEIEYEVVSQIVRLWLLNVNEDFRQSYGAVEWIIHRKTNVSRDGWFLRCGVAEVATFAYGWNTTECVTENVNSTWTTCLCPRLGTIALLLTANNVQVEQEPLRPRRYLVLAGCSFCFLSALICTIFLAAHWILKRSCIIFLKLQCSISVTGVMLTFFLATIVEPPEGMFTNIMTLIEILLLMGLSAHVSTLLVVYTELVQLPKAATSKQTVIGISTGVPVIAVFGNHLAHRTMDVRLRSWWMLAGTLAFHIFVTVSTVIFALFLFLYFTVVSKLRRLTVVHEKDGKILQRRIRLLRKSACVCCSLVMVTTSSVLYINFSEVIWWHYEFCVSTVLLGLTLVVCYVITSETRLSILLQEKLKAKTKEGFFGVEPTGSPLNFFTKEDAEVESESIPHRKSETHHHLSKSVECFQMTDACKSALPECVSGTIESFIHHEDIMFRNGSRDQTVMIATEHLERYNHSPQLYRKNTTFKIDEEAAAAKAPPVPARCRSPDIIASKTCTALDLVMSHAPSIVITPEEPSVEQQNVTTTVATSNEDWSLKRQASQDDALPVSTKVAEVAPSVTTSSPTPSEDNLDGMLDRISHDLDYLLNRGDAEISTVTNAGSLRRVPKTPPSVIVEVDEETESEETKVPEAITDILRTNC